MVVMFRNLHPWHLNIPCTLPLLVEMQCHGSFMPCPGCPLKSFNGGSSLLYSWFARTAWKLASRHQGAVTEEGIVEVARECSEAENDVAPSLVAFSRKHSARKDSHACVQHTGMNHCKPFGKDAKVEMNLTWCHGAGARPTGLGNREKPSRKSTSKRDYRT